MGVISGIIPENTLLENSLSVIVTHSNNLIQLGICNELNWPYEVIFVNQFTALWAVTTTPNSIVTAMVNSDAYGRVCYIYVSIEIIRRSNMSKSDE